MSVLGAAAMTVEEAARALDVTARQIRKLVASGRLTVLGTVGSSLVLDASSVEAAARADRARGRPWSAQAAWVAIHELSGTSELPFEVAAHVRSRVRRQLLDITPERLLEVTRQRARVTRWAAPVTVSQEAGRYVAATGLHALARGAYTDRIDLVVADPHCDGYLGADLATELPMSWSLQPDPRGRVTLRAVMDEDMAPGQVAPIAAVALDLMGSDRVRDRAAGTTLLQQLLTAWQDHHNGTATRAGKSAGAGASGDATRRRSAR